jgi:hypothetical protein
MNSYIVFYNADYIKFILRSYYNILMVSIYSYLLIEKKDHYYTTYFVKYIF